MTSMGRARLVLALVVLGATGLGVAAYLHERDEDALRKDSAGTADASADASAKVAKGKPPAKKKTSRGGKTRVTGRSAPPTAPNATGHVDHSNHSNPVDHSNHGEPSSHGEGDHGAGAAGPPPHAPPHRHYGPPSGASYESAIGSNNQHVTIGAAGGADLTDAQLSGPMSDGSFIDECGAPDDMGITVKVAIKMGRAVGVSVSTSPRSADVANCIDHHIRGLSWPSSPKMDSLVTTY
jgi:hypothetical protein